MINTSFVNLNFLNVDSGSLLVYPVPGSLNKKTGEGSIFY
jgi:hypothetical protein